MEVTPQELVTAWQAWCVDNQCDVNSFCTSATKKLVEMIEEGDLLAKRKGKADMKEFEEYYLSFEREFRNTVAPIDTPDEKKYFKMFWQAASASSRTATLKEILEALPNNKTLEESEFTEHSGTFNECVAEIRAIIEKKLEGK